MEQEKLHPGQQVLVEAVHAEFDRVLVDIAPQLDKRPEPVFADRDYRSVQAAQNTLRTCLEALLNRMLPYGENVPVELAIRLASYAISAMPVESQDAAVKAFMEIFPAAHIKRVKAGIRISTMWQIDGRERGNFPAQDS